MGPPFHRPASILRRPLSSATAALRAASPGRPRHGAEFLAQLLDFEGAVQLAQTLDAPAPPLAPTIAPEAAVARARQRLATTEREARLPLHDPHTGASLVAPERVAGVLAKAGVPATRQRKSIEAAARELFAPVESRALQRIGSVRRVVAEIRRELAPALAASGARAARLEQIDAALTGATAARSDALLARAVAAVGDAFAADLERAVLALPKPCLELPVAEWTGAGGLVTEHVGRCEALAFAAFVHERARVDMLVADTVGERLA